LTFSDEDGAAKTGLAPNPAQVAAAAQAEQPERNRLRLGLFRISNWRT